MIVVILISRSAINVAVPDPVFREVTVMSVVLSPFSKLKLISPTEVITLAISTSESLTPAPSMSMTSVTPLALVERPMSKLDEASF